MRMDKLAKDLMDVVEPRAFIKQSNIDKLRTLRSMEKQAMRNQVNHAPDLGPMNFYKAAYLHGKNRFQKEAENVMIWKGLDELKKKSLNKEASYYSKFIPKPAGTGSYLDRLKSGWRGLTGAWDEATAQAWNRQRGASQMWRDPASGQVFEITRPPMHPGTLADRYRYSVDHLRRTDPAAWETLRNTAIAGGAGLGGMALLNSMRSPTVVYGQ